MWLEDISSELIYDLDDYEDKLDQENRNNPKLLMDEIERMIKKYSKLTGSTATITIEKKFN